MVREAGEVHLYSGVFSVVAEDSAKFNKEDNKEDNMEEEIHALLPHFLAFSSLAKAGFLKGKIEGIGGISEITEVGGLRVMVLNLSTGHLSLLKVGSFSSSLFCDHYSHLLFRKTAIVSFSFLKLQPVIVEDDNFEIWLPGRNTFLEK